MSNIFEQIYDAIKNKFEGDLSNVDLATKLDRKAEGTKLKWRESVVDLLTLIEFDVSSENRRILALELGVTGKPGDAKTNEALRVALIKRLKERGIDLPEKSGKTKEK